MGIALQQADRGHQEARRAEAALQAVFLPEGLLHGMVFLRLRQTLDGLHLGAVGLHRQHHAALDRLPIQQDGAGAALPGVTPDMRPGKIQALAQILYEQLARLDLTLFVDSIDLDVDILAHTCRSLRSRRRIIPTRRPASAEGAIHHHGHSAQYSETHERALQEPHYEDDYLKIQEGWMTLIGTLWLPWSAEERGNQAGL